MSRRDFNSFSPSQRDRKAPLEMSDKLPAYETIKRHVLARIHDGTWKEGDAIPGEEALAREFGVSRMTVWRKLKALEAA